jgi:hypothetical protein
MPSGAVYAGLSGVQTSGALFSGFTSWRVVAVADMDKDGLPDLVWQSPTGQVVIWLMHGTTVFRQFAVLTSGTFWKVVGVADLMVSGNPDLLWQGPTDALALWEINVSNLSMGGSVVGS